MFYAVRIIASTSGPDRPDSQWQSDRNCPVATRSCNEVGQLKSAPWYHAVACTTLDNAFPQSWSSKAIKNFPAYHDRYIVTRITYIHRDLRILISIQDRKKNDNETFQGDSGMVHTQLLACCRGMGTLELEYLQFVCIMKMAYVSGWHTRLHPSQWHRVASRTFKVVFGGNHPLESPVICPLPLMEGHRFGLHCSSRRLHSQQDYSLSTTLTLALPSIDMFLRLSFDTPWMQRLVASLQYRCWEAAWDQGTHCLMTKG